MFALKYAKNRMYINVVAINFICNYIISMLVLVI